MTTPTMRREAVRHLVRTTPLSQVGLLRARLRREADLVAPGGCSVCWQPRSSSETCKTRVCRDVLNELREREAELHERAKAGLLAAVEEGAHAA